MSLRDCRGRFATDREKEISSMRFQTARKYDIIF